MAVAFLFPGQASQFVGMGRDIYDASGSALEVFDLADRMTGSDIKIACFDGPEDRLKQTAVTQPAIFAHSIAACRMLVEAGTKPDLVAGHSVGELAALVAAGAMSLDDGMRVVAVRGRAMQVAGEGNPGTMAAILGLDDVVVSDICASVQGTGTVTPANFNCPGQVVISGRPENVRAAVEEAKSRGAKRAVELQVSGAFHSELMTSAVSALEEALSEVRFSEPTVPVVPNVTAEPTRDPDLLKRLLAKQVVSPVRWTASMQRLAGEGVDRAYEVGPGNTLKGLMRRIDRNVQVSCVGTLAEVQESTR
jgi:[acyl-carrier-protein] S-malonyltransferase